MLMLNLAVLAQTEISIYKSKKEADVAYTYMPSSFFYEESIQPDMVEVIGIAPSIEEVNKKVTITGFLVTFTRNKYFSKYFKVIIYLFTQDDI